MIYLYRREPFNHMLNWPDLRVCLRIAFVQRELYSSTGYLSGSLYIIIQVEEMIYFFVFLHLFYNTYSTHFNIGHLEKIFFSC